jgi:hypothetical protein
MGKTKRGHGWAPKKKGKVASQSKAAKQEHAQEKAKLSRAKAVADTGTATPAAAAAPREINIIDMPGIGARDMEGRCLACYFTFNDRHCLGSVWVNPMRRNQGESFSQVEWKHLTDVFHALKDSKTPSVRPHEITRYPKHRGLRSKTIYLKSTVIYDHVLNMWIKYWPTCPPNLYYKVPGWTGAIRLPVM